MEWRKGKEGERISTPMFMGVTDMSGAEKCKQLLACGHKWEAVGEEAEAEGDPEVKLQSYMCPVCRGSRLIVRGLEEKLVAAFDEQFGVK